MDITSFSSNSTNNIRKGFRMVAQVRKIIQFNEDAGLLEKGYDDSLEPAFQIEEALEGFNLTKLSKLLAPREPVMNPKEVSRAIIKVARHSDKTPIKEVDRLDKHIDGLIYHIGSLAKQGLSLEQMCEAVDVVMTANQAKVQCPKDEAGKLLKPLDFDELFAPEPALQQILDRRACVNTNS